jgi:hypothetical protein
LALLGVALDKTRASPKVRKNTKHIVALCHTAVIDFDIAPTQLLFDDRYTFTEQTRKGSLLDASALPRKDEEGFSNHLPPEYRRLEQAATSRSTR